MAYPKILYTPTGGAEQTLTFSAPARLMPGYARIAVRHDNVATAGIRESVLERMDDILEITVEWIKATEVSVWQSFLDHALTGAAFAYYPDASLSSFTNYGLEDTEAKLEWKAPGQYTVTLKMRKQVV
jgi:hypothetical protein